MGKLGNGRIIVDGAYEVGAEGETDQGCLFGDQPFEIRNRRLAGFGVNLPLLDHCAELGQPPTELSGVRDPESGFRNNAGTRRRAPGSLGFPLGLRLQPKTLIAVQVCPFVLFLFYCSALSHLSTILTAFSKSLRSLRISSWELPDLPALSALAHG